MRTANLLRALLQIRSYAGGYCGRPNYAMTFVACVRARAEACGGPAFTSLLSADPDNIAGPGCVRFWRATWLAGCSATRWISCGVIQVLVADCATGPITGAANPTFVDIPFARVGFSLLHEANPAWYDRF